MDLRTILWALRNIPEKIWKKIKKALKRDGDDVLIFMGMNSMDELTFVRTPLCSIR
jgi:hypothetical protein